MQTGVTFLQDQDYGWSVQCYISPSPIIKRTDGFYYRCGYNVHGSVGEGTETQRNSFTLMRFPFGTHIKFFGSLNTATNGLFTIAVTDNDEVYGWGYNGDYLIGPWSYNGNIWTPVKLTPKQWSR